MAFFNKVSCLMRQSIFRNSLSAQAAPVLQMLVQFRSASSKRIFVGGLSFGTDDKQLKEAFSNFGAVIDARVILDRETGKSRGFGFVNFENDEDAGLAKSGMDGQELNGRAIRITFASDDRRPARFGSGFVNQGNGVNGAGSGGQGEPLEASTGKM